MSFSYPSHGTIRVDTSNDTALYSIVSREDRLTGLTEKVVRFANSELVNFVEHALLSFGAYPAVLKHSLKELRSRRIGPNQQHFSFLSLRFDLPELEEPVDLPISSDKRNKFYDSSFTDLCLRYSDFKVDGKTVALADLLFRQLISPDFIRNGLQFECFTQIDLPLGLPEGRIYRLTLSFLSRLTYHPNTQKFHFRTVRYPNTQKNYNSQMERNILPYPEEGPLPYKKMTDSDKKGEEPHDSALIMSEFLKELRETYVREMEQLESTERVKEIRWLEAEKRLKALQEGIDHETATTAPTRLNYSSPSKGGIPPDHQPFPRRLRYLKSEPPTPTTNLSRRGSLANDQVDPEIAPPLSDFVKWLSTFIFAG